VCIKDRKRISNAIYSYFYLQPYNIESEHIHSISNNPAHILDSQGNISPSAFIPFCEFGGDMEVMGEKIDKFELPVCNKFRPIMIEDQLCYQIDINELKGRVDIKKAAEYGFILLLDYNDERNPKIQRFNSKLDVLNDLIGLQKTNDESPVATVYINTLGRK
jgi:hypothetical protein